MSLNLQPVGVVKANKNTMNLLLTLVAMVAVQGKVFSFSGSSDGSACIAAVRNIFDFSASCKRPPCTFNGVHQPPVHGNYLVCSCLALV